MDIKEFVGYDLNRQASKVKSNNKNIKNKAVKKIGVCKKGKTR